MKTLGRIFCLLLCCLPMLAQMGPQNFAYTSSYVITDEDNHPNWPNYNTWVAVPNSPSNLAGLTASIVPGNASIIKAWDTSGNVWNFADQLPNNNTGWAEQTAYGLVHALASNENGTLFALTAAQESCPANHYPLKQWTGSAWVYVTSGSCGTLVAASSDRVYTVDLVPTVAVWYTTGSSWVQLPALIGSGTVTGLRVTDDDLAVFIVQGGKLYFCDGTAWYLIPIPTSNDIVSFTMDSGGQIFISDSDSVKGHNTMWRNTSGGTAPTWAVVGTQQNINPMVFSFLASGGPMLTFGIHDGSAYRISPFAKKVVGTMTGSGNCASGCNGITHDVVLRDLWNAFGGAEGHAGNSASIHNGPYTDYVNLTSLDIGWSAWDCLTLGPECEMGHEADIDCSATGQHDAGSTNTNPGLCIIPPDKSWHWTTGQAIHVYFDKGAYGSQGNCPGSAWCYIMQGINSWSSLGYNDYINEGMVTGCGGLPCNPVYPYIWVTMLYNCGDNTDRLIYDLDSHGNLRMHAIMGFQQCLMQEQKAFLQISGAHEEGHNHMLANCVAGDPKCTASVSQTVMWEGLDARQPNTPSPCDLSSAQAYLTFFY